MRVLILGCGYVGSELGHVLARLGHDVYGLRRSLPSPTEDETAKLHLLAGDLTQPKDLEALPSPFDWVVNTVSSSRGGVTEYRRAFLDGTRTVLEWLANAQPQKYVFTSSTSVYGQTDGSLVDESSLAQPDSLTGQILVQTEELLRDAAQRGFPAVILRVAGIYGPGRGHLFQQYLRGEARLSQNHQRYLNMVHRDDVVGSIVRVLEAASGGICYNVTDDEPVTERAFFTWLSEQLGKPLPPAADAAPRERKRAVTNKRVSNQKLKAQLGYQLKYPTFREGYAHEIRGVTSSSGLRKDA